MFRILTFVGGGGRSCGVVQSTIKSVIMRQVRCTSSECGFRQFMSLPQPRSREHFIVAIHTTLLMAYNVGSYVLSGCETDIFVKRNISPTMRTWVLWDGAGSNRMPSVLPNL